MPVLKAQTITTTLTNSNGSSVLVFNVINTNTDPVILTDIGSLAGTVNTFTCYLYAREVAYNSPTATPTAITAAGGWTVVGSNLNLALNGSTNTALTGSDAEPFITGMSYLIPGTTQIQFALQLATGANQPEFTTTGGSLRYSTVGTQTCLFSAAGIEIQNCTGYGFGGTMTAPNIGERGLIGYMSFMPATPCSGTPNAGIANANPTVACQNGTANLSLSGATLGTGISYQWFISSDDITYAPIAGATTASYQATLSFAGTNYFRCEVTCDNGGLSATSSTVSVVGGAQMSGVYTINNLLPTGGINFNNFQDAFDALACGSNGPVTLNVEAGQLFESTGALVAEFSGSAANPIVFQKSGAGANPSISFTGTSGTTDAGLTFNGADWITWDGIDIMQGGTSTADWFEYGIYLTKAAGNDGASNNTFQNFTIDMGTTTVTNARGVFMANTVAATSPDGASSNNVFDNLTITNVLSAGIWIAGSTTAGNQDVNNSFTNCNIISNDANIVSYGIYVTGQDNCLISNNTLGNHIRTNTSAHYPIYVTGTSATTNVTINGNIVENVENVSTGIIYGIYIFNGGAIDISENTIRNLNSGGTIRGIYLNGVAATTSDVHRNRIYGINCASVTTSNAAGIQSGPGVNRIYNNMITGITAENSTATPGVRGLDVTGGASQEIYNNTVILSGTSNSSASMAWTTTIALDVRNNIFVNNSTSGNFASAMYRSTAGAPNFNPASGNNLYYAGVPSPTNLIYRNAGNGIEDLVSYLAQSVESVGYTENLQFTLLNGEVSIDQTVETYVESGGQDLTLVTVDYFGTQRGPYPLAGQQPNGGTSTDVGAEENDFLRNVPMSAPECATLNAPANNIIDVCTSIPVTLSWTPALTGPIPTDGYDVFFGTTTPPPFVQNLTATSYAPTNLIAGQTYYWSVAPKNGAGAATGCDIFNFTTASHVITTSTPGSVCGLGQVELQATASNGNVHWYANPTGGSSLGTGNTFTTPSLNTTTTFYAAAVLGGGNANVGLTNVTGATSGSGTTNFGVVFDAISPFTLLEVTVYPVSTTSSPGTVTVDLIDGNNVILNTATFNVVGSPGGINPVVLPLNFSVDAGTNLKLRPGSFTGISGLLFGPAAAAPNGNYGYPFVVPGVVSINHSTLTAAPANTQRLDLYYYFYNWLISTGCESPRVPVVATVTPADVVTINPSATNSCPGENITLSASSANTNYTYSWEPGNLTGASVVVNPTETTTYVVTGTDGICTDTTHVTINVNGAVLGTITGATDICNGESTTFTLNGSVGDIQWQSFDGTQWNNIAGETNASITVSPTVDTDYRVALAFTGCPTVNTPSVSVVVTTVETPTVQGGSVCGVGTVDLQASTSQGEIHWWNVPTGGAPLATGNNFTTPTINTTTTYYASNIDGGTTFNTSVLTPFGTAATVLTTYGQVFTADIPFTLNSVQVHSTTGSAITISLFNSNGTTMLETTGSVAVTPGTSPIIPLNFTIAPGTYRLAINGMTGNFIRDNSGVSYPFPLDNSIGTMLGFHSSITGAVTTTSSYYFAYNWNVSTGCESPRIPVEATVTPADLVTITPSATTSCPNDLVSLTASAANANYTYEWVPGNISGATIEVNPSATTTYTVTATDGTCTDIQEVTITVTGAEVGAISAPTSMCFGDDRTLSIAGVVGNIQWQSFDGTDWNDIAGETSQTITTSPGSTTDYRVSVGFPGCPLIFSNSTTITVNDPTPLNPQGSALCDEGDATFSVTAPAGTTIEWFDAPVGGNLIGSGETLTTNIAQTTTLYAQGSSGGGSGTVGPLNPASVGTFSTWNSTAQWMNFTVEQATTIESVDIFFSAAVGAPFTVVIRENITNNIVFTYNGTVSVSDASASTPQVVSLNAALAPGDYQMNFGTAAATFRNSTGGVYPYTLPGILSITGNTFDPVYYYVFYNWQVASGCESGLVPVTSTVGVPVEGTDVVVSCGSYTWIDGNLYTQNNNTQTFLIPGGAASGCDSLVTLDLTIINFTPTATDNGDLTITASEAVSYQWVTCPSLTPIAGETSQTLTVTENGLYAVTATDANGCESTSACVNINYVNVEGWDINSVSVYPNPTDNEVIIEFNSTDAKIELFDIQGKLILSKQHVSGEKISILNEQSGVYLLRITTDKASSLHRIIKQ